MRNRRRALGAVLLGLVFPFFAAAQRGQVHPTPQQLAEVNRLLADASAAVNQISGWDIQRNDLMQLVGMYCMLGEQARNHAIVQAIRKKYEALSEANASGQNPPPGMRFEMNSAMELSMVALGAAQFGDVPDALDIMKQIGYQGPAGQALNMIAIRQAQEGDVQGAMQTVARIRVEGWRESALREIVYTHLQNHDISAALAAAAEIPPSPERVHQLISIAHAQLLAGNRQAAVGLVAEAQKIATQLPESPPPGPQNFGVSYICSSGPNRSPRDQALQYLAQGQWELGDHAAAMATRDQIQSASLKEQTLNNFIKVDAGANRFAEAAQLVEKIPPGPCRNDANAAIAPAQVAAGDVTDAVARASEIQPASSMTWINLAMKAKDPAAAKMLFSRAWAAAANAPTELDYAQELYGIAAFENLKQGFHQAYCVDSAEAIRLAREARAKGQRFPPGAMSIANALVDEQVVNFAQCGKLAQAKTLALTQQGSPREDEIGRIAAIEAESGDVQGAENWAQSFTSPNDRARALIGVAIGILHPLQARAARQ